MLEKYLVYAIEGAIFALIGYAIWRFKKLMDDSAKAEEDTKDKK